MSFFAILFAILFAVVWWWVTFKTGFLKWFAQPHICIWAFAGFAALYWFYWPNDWWEWACALLYTGFTAVQGVSWYQRRQERHAGEPK